jgi:hypothetical protein
LSGFLTILKEDIVRRRLYSTLPDVEHCKQLVTELKQAGLTDKEIHVVAREDVPLEGLHQATVLDKTELKHGLELGASVGGVAGMLGSILAITFPPAGIVIAGGALTILATTMAGASFGAMVSALVARDIPNHELEEFQLDIDAGKVLLILDVTTVRVDEIMQVIKSTHPEAVIGVVHPT